MSSAGCIKVGSLSTQEAEGRTDWLEGHTVEAAHTHSLRIGALRGGRGWMRGKVGGMLAIFTSTWVSFNL